MAFRDLRALALGASADRKRIVLRTDAPWRGPDAAFTFGIEEEYFLADAKTFETPEFTPEGLFEAAGFATGGQSTHEFIQAQVEVATNVHASLRDARAELAFLRREVGRVAAQYGLVIMACGTHPTAMWSRMNPTPKARYVDMMDDLQMIGRRDLVCGMHVHVQLPDPARRVEVMRRMTPFLPLFVALSASSPFWHGRDTGLKAYRLAAYDELPRSGIPDLFESEQAYADYVETMVRGGAIADASYIWWMARPSARRPTLELRACDCCTRIEDALALAALYRALARRLTLDPEINADLTAVDRALAVENKWRAQRFGVQGSFVTRSEAVAVGDLVDDLVALVAMDAIALDCVDEVEHCRAIVRDGTAADGQIAVYREASRAPVVGAPLTQVSRWIAGTTLHEASGAAQPPL
ncbi:MAG: carboxylate-amine ligase [Pseudomonadota bacterium]